MTSRSGLIGALFLGAAITCAAAHAEAEDADEATITVVEEGATPDDVVNVIELPDHAAATATDKAAGGLDTANSAKENGSDFGKQVSEDARNNRGAQVREDAQQQAHSDARNDNPGGNRRTPPH